MYDFHPHGEAFFLNLWRLFIHPEQVARDTPLDYIQRQNQLGPLGYDIREPGYLQRMTHGFNVMLDTLHEPLSFALIKKLLSALSREESSRPFHLEFNFDIWFKPGKKSKPQIATSFNQLLMKLSSSFCVKNQPVLSLILNKLLIQQGFPPTILKKYTHTPLATEFVAEIDAGVERFKHLMDIKTPWNADTPHEVNYIHFFENPSLMAIFIEQFFRTPEFSSIPPELAAKLKLKLKTLVVSQNENSKHGYSFCNFQRLTTQVRQIIRMEPAASCFIGIAHGTRHFGHYQAGINHRISGKYRLGETQRDDFYFFDKKIEYQQYCEKIHVAIQAPLFSHQALQYYAAMNHLDVPGTAPKLNKDFFQALPGLSGFSLMIGFSGNAETPNALFILTPYVLQRDPTAAIIKLCRKLTYNQATNAFNLDDENYLVKISDARQDLSNFGEGYKLQLDSSEDSRETIALSPRLSQREQCIVWDKLMQFRRLRGAKTYGNYYYASRSDLSRAGNYLKKYLFMPMLNGVNLDYFSLKDTSLLSYEMLREPILQSAMDLYILHEILGRIHGDVAHGSANRFAGRAQFSGSNIFLSNHEERRDGILIDFEASTIIGQNKYQAIAPFYLEHSKHLNLGGEIAKPAEDLCSFLGLIEDIFLTAKQDLPPYLSELPLLLKQAQLYDVPSEIILNLLIKDPENTRKVIDFFKLIKHCKEPQVQSSLSIFL